MKIVLIRKFGPREVMELTTIPTPEPKANEVLVRIHATSVNPIDWKIRSGEFKWLVGFRFPKYLGCEFSGVVVKNGTNSSRFKAGDEIFGITNGHKSPVGTYAEFISIPENLITFKPKNISHEEAAALPVGSLTALDVFKKLSPSMSFKGMNVLIHGASGGVGTMAVQIAKHWGAYVTAVCSEANLEYVKELGADEAISYSTENYLLRVKKQDIFFDVASFLNLSDAHNCLKDKGHFITLIPNGRRVLDTIKSLFSSTKMRICLMKPTLENLEDSRKLVEENHLKAKIERVLPLTEIQKAHEFSETGHAKGKTIIQVG